MLPDGPALAVFLAAIRRSRTRRLQAWGAASILAGLALRIALPEYR